MLDEAPAASAKIVVRNLSCTRRQQNGKILDVLDRVNFEVPTGCIVTLIGPSGCGKTTILNSIAGLLGPTSPGVTLSGEVRVGEYEPAEAMRRRLFGLCSQKPALLPWRNVADNVGLPLELAGVCRRKRDPRITELLEMIQLQEFRNARVWELSGGMQHRVSLARSLALAPPVLLMDEPFAATDEPLRERLNAEMLRVWAKTRHTVVFVTHNLSDAILLGHWSVVLSERPAKVREVLEINLPTRSPSVQTSRTFAQYLEHIRATLRETG